MIPLRDDQPSLSTPFVNYFLIGLNILVFIFELMVGGQSRGALNALIFQFGVVPTHEVALLSGTPTFSPAAALLPILTSMFLHASWGHVIGNMWFLWIFGKAVEALRKEVQQLVRGAGFSPRGTSVPPAGRR